MITLIAAVTEDGVIGKKGNSPLLWHSKIDLTFFKAETERKVLVMGHDTYKSIGKSLKDRKVIVLSRSHDPGTFNGVTFYNKIGDILQDYSDFYVAGGEEIYNLFLPLADRIILSRIDVVVVSDTTPLAYFPLNNPEFYENFVLVQQSNPVVDIDTNSGNNIHIIFEEWLRQPSHYH